MLPARPGHVLARRGALSRTPVAEGPGRRAAELEARLRAALEEVTALDLELEALSAALADFARAWERALGPAFGERGLAERLVRRLAGLEDALHQEALRVREAEPGPRRRRRPEPPGKHRSWRARAGAGRETDEPRAAPGTGQAGPAAAGADEPEFPPEVEAAIVQLKRLHRRLARLLHPDLANDDAARARLSALMAQVNAAYTRGDLTELSLLAERLGAGEPLGEVSEEERRAHLEARIANLERIAASLARERERLLSSHTERLRAEAAGRAAAGGDLVEETRAELHAETEAARADAVARLDRLERAAGELSRARRERMSELARRGPTGARRAFDPLRESELVRLGAARLEEQRATAAARELSRRLEDAARATPWEVGLTCLAFFAEAAGARLPDSLATAEGWAGTWETLRPGWPGAPELARCLERLPPHLTMGARRSGEEVRAGLQLAAADLCAGVALALERRAVSEVGAAVLSALGPRQACGGCGAEAPARHLHRTRGLDTLHGLVCPGCGAVLRSYWRYGEVDGLERLAPHALRLGLVAEVSATLAGTALGFQMLPAEAGALTADRLRRRFAEIYLVPCEVEVALGHLQILAGDGPLGPGARVAGRGPLELLPGPAAGLTGPELLEVLRARIERRFRP